MPLDADVEVHIGQLSLAGHMNLPPGSVGLVVFAHGSGSSRHSPRNRFVAEVLNDASLGTLLFDLLTPEEEQDRRNVCGVPAIYTLLRVVEAKEGKLLRYEQAVDQAGQSVVSFMAGAFYGSRS